MTCKHVLVFGFAVRETMHNETRFNYFRLFYVT